LIHCHRARRRVLRHCGSGLCMARFDVRIDPLLVLELNSQP
jgi:hypothetical protein